MWSNGTVRVSEETHEREDLMSHLRLVPPLPPEPDEVVAETALGAPYDDPKVALMFFQAASGLCLCRACTMARHPAFGAR
jgi:hypothetical protein